MIKLITHNDLDGIGCYIVGKYFLDDEIDVSFCSYGNVNDIALEVVSNIDSYDMVFITDISISEDTAKKLNKYNKKIRLLDHHPTALPLNKYEWANVTINFNGINTCGTELFYHLLTNSKETKNLKRFVELVRRYDTWHWKELGDIQAKELNDLLYIIGKEEFIKNIICKIQNDNKLIFDEQDKYILKLRQNEIDRYIEKKNKNIITKEILGYNAGIVFADNFISELGNKLSELHPELDFIAMINQETISYRTTNNNIDLSEIAKAFGGGGHPKASGSQISKDCIEEFIDILFNI